MLTNKLLTWSLVTALVFPQGVLAFSSGDAVPERERLTTAALATTRGGEHPVAKIGGQSDRGFLNVRTGSGSCASGDFLSTPVIPAFPNAVLCNQAIPTISAGEGVLIELGGDAANLSGFSAPRFRVYINGVEVPASQLGSQFLSSCPQVAAPFGTATVSQQMLTLFGCRSGTNFISFPTSMLDTGFNIIAVEYGFSQAAFQAPGDDIDSRIIFKVGVG